MVSHATTTTSIENPPEKNNRLPFLGKRAAAGVCNNWKGRRLGASDNFLASKGKSLTRVDCASSAHFCVTVSTLWPAGKKARVGGVGHPLCTNETRGREGIRASSYGIRRRRRSVRFQR